MNVIIMVSSGYPFHFSANNTKGEYIACGLKEAGVNVAIMDDLYGTKGIFSIKKGVSCTGIPYVLFPRKGRKLFSFIHVVPMIWRYMKEFKGEEENHLITGMHQYPFYFVVIMMAWLLGYKRSALFHEWHAGFKNVALWRRIEANIKDCTFGYFLNLILPISHYLERKSLHFHKPMLLLPVLADYNRTPRLYSVNNQFAYCCAAEFLLRSTIIMDAFEILTKKNKDVQLILILTGYDWKKKEIDSLLSNYSCRERILIKSQLPQEELFDIYEKSIALLLPLDPNSLQDKARFSQKIAEYVSTGRPVVTNPVGEIPYYFKQEESAMIVDYTANGFYTAMQTLADDKVLAERIGKGGFNVGAEFFDYRKIGMILKETIKGL